ncbi:MAG TPA: hypothetical protein VM782_08330 [Stellaceae bacterium]|nr:hypothetical protein [Stellaceae bacterium]
MKSLICSAFTAGLFAIVCASANAAAPISADPVPADTITFDQYRDWRLHFIEERQIQIAAELAQKDVTAPRRTALERQKAYYDYFAAMPATDRDRLFRERFNEIDTNHDGIIDHNERAAWHEKQRAFYDRSNFNRRETAANTPTRR